MLIYRIMRKHGHTCMCVRERASGRMHTLCHYITLHIIL